MNKILQEKIETFLLVESEYKLVYANPEAKKKAMKFIKHHSNKYEIISGEKSTDSSITLKTKAKQQEVLDDVALNLHTINGKKWK